MYQEALRSPKLLRASALQKLGVLAFPHAYSSIGGEPLQENGKIVCVEHMDNEALANAHRRWADLQASFEAELCLSEEPHNQSVGHAAKKIIIDFSAAAVGAIGMFLSSDIKALGYPLALATGGMAVKGLFSLKAKNDLTQTREEDIIAYEIVRGNAAACQWETIKRNLAARVSDPCLS